MSGLPWWRALWARNKKSASLAKERLQIVISQERAARNGGQRPPDYLPALQRELQLVVAKYVKVPPRDITVRFGHPRHAPDALEVRIELPQAATA